YEGARKTWEQVRNAYPGDVAANLGLANVFERQYRVEQRPELLEQSNQAIERVLADVRTTVDQRAEAAALEGRNLKTLWRREFEDLASPAARREKAISRRLRDAYEAYLTAYRVDLNHYWSGLAALQMGSVALDLARDEAWADAFDTTEEAQAYATALRG